MNSAILKTTVKGHVNIKNDLGEVLFDGPNAVHNQNMAVAIARGLSHSDYSLATGNHQIFALELGNGGTSIDSMSQITYLPPNITGTDARLYSQTYYDIVDPGSSLNVNGNSVTYQQSNTDTTSIVIVTMTIPAGLPAGQDPSDSPPDPNPNSTYSFDELGLFTGSNTLFTYTTTPSDALLLTHIIFSPILKTANRELVVTYTLTVSVS
jgi:hypothetical protein